MLTHVVVTLSSCNVVQQVVLTNQMTTRIMKGEKSQLVPALGKYSEIESDYNMYVGKNSMESILDLWCAKTVY